MAYWKPGDPKPSELINIDYDQLSVVYNPRRHLPIVQQRKELPLYSHSTLGNSDLHFLSPHLLR